MNHGYFFLIACWILLILVYFHWLDFMWKDKQSPSLWRRWCGIGISVLIISQVLYLPISPSISVNVGSALLLSGLVLYQLWVMDSSVRLQMLSVILFLGIFIAVSYEIFYLDPILMVAEPFYLLPSFLVLFLLLTTGSLKQQWLMMLGGFILGEILHKCFMLPYVSKVYIGDAEFRDMLMMGLIMMTISTFTLKGLTKAYKESLKRLIFFKKQEG